MPAFADSNVDRRTVEHVLELLENRLEAVATYGAGGCPTCHDAELRGAIQLLRRVATAQGASSSLVTSAARARRR
jgi:hypothetical protein